MADFVRILSALALLAGLGLLAGFGGALHPALDSFAHFRLHLAAALLAASFALLLSRAYVRAAGGIALALAAAWTTLPYLPPQAGGAAIASSDMPDGPVYRMLQFNIRYDNDDSAAILRTIARTDPDIILLQEYTPLMMRALKPLETRYRFQLNCLSGDPVGGTAILSRRPFADVVKNPDNCPLRFGKLAVAPVDFGGLTLNVASIHLSWPWPHGQARDMNDIVALAPGRFAPDLLAGDFNATPWSATAERMRTMTGLANVGGLGFTWLYRTLPHMLRPWVGLPIDQTMTGEKVVVLSARTLPDAGSDHLPTLVEFTIPVRATEPAVETVSLP